MRCSCSWVATRNKRLGLLCWHLVCAFAGPALHLAWVLGLIGRGVGGGGGTMPALLRRYHTLSDGWAPTASQYLLPGTANSKGRSRILLPALACSRW